MSFILLILLLSQGLLMIGIFVASVVMIYWMISSKLMRHAPSVPTCGKVKQAMISDVASVIKKRSQQVVMDLGSGWGTLLLPLARQFPQHRFVGIEYGLFPYLVSKWRARKLKNITFYRQNLFCADISRANVIFLFLLTKGMTQVEPKCKKEAQTGTLIYANRFPMPHLKAKKEVSLGSKYNTYYIYET